MTRLAPLSSPSYSLAFGDVLDVLRTLPDSSADALLCDPPYGLRFMGQKWDYDVPSIEVWRECLRVLKPGAPLLSFGGSRTWHRIAVNIEDAGFEIWDSILWLYSQAMPKPATRTGKYIRDACARRHINCVACGETASLWEEHGHALRPSHEPVILARKPLDGGIAENVLRHGVGGLNVAGCRIERDPSDKSGWSQTGSKASENVAMSGANYARDAKQDAPARWPANVILSEEAAEELDAQTGITKSTPYRANDATGAVLPMTHRTAGGYSDSGGASRYFYCAKVSRKEREKGCESLPLRSAAEATNRKEGSAGADRPQAGAGRGSGARNIHPTLKPLSLTTYLARLILPPTADALLLVPYCGAGSEMIGALLAGWPCVLGIERTPEYLPIARARIPAWTDGVEVL